MKQVFICSYYNLQDVIPIGLKSLPAGWSFYKDDLSKIVKPQHYIDNHYDNMMVFTGTYDSLNDFRNFITETFKQFKTEKKISSYKIRTLTIDMK